ncbi:hypothetical protein AcW1_007217 [Taiwanofungus camphoratus]|nr:hypothetical protein AcW1_007217 [Antrodia cinnamomea]
MHVKNLANQLVLNGSTSPSADLAQLDRIDEQLREAMVCIRSARNSISPANRLPPEVMSPIFAELASSARRELDPQRPTKRFMSVVAVCRHWRRTALSCHALWATVVIDKWTSPEAAAAVLRRSGVLPLTVFFRKAGELLSVLTPHVSRLRRLCLIKTAPFTLFPFFAPPTDCFERLTQLYLCNLCYDQLRHLDTFFDFIEATPNLETLDLNEASQFPRPNEVSVFPLQRRLALPRLRTLCFHGCRWEAIAWVLRHFTFSGSVSIYAEVNSLTYLTDMGAVFQEDAAFLSHLRALTKLDVWAIANKLCMSCSGLGVALELCFIWNGYIVDGDIRGVNSMFMALLPRILHLIDVTELRMKIGGKYLPYIGSIQDLFQDLPAVESCTIELGLEKDKAQYWHGTVYAPSSIALHWRA